MCQHCCRFFANNQLFEEGSFSGQNGYHYHASLKGPSYPGLYTLIWKNEGGTKEVSLTIEVACSCSNGVH